MVGVCWRKPHCNSNFPECFGSYGNIFFCRSLEKCAVNLYAKDCDWAYRLDIRKWVNVFARFFSVTDSS